MIELFGYQKEGMRLISRFGGRALLADQMGLGKTAQGLVWMRQNVRPPCIVICPASLKLNWQRESWRFARIKAEILEGRNPSKSWKPRRKLLIINYDILPGWADRLRSLWPSLVILDECQYIKSTKAKRTKAARNLCKIAPHIIAMSGTPITNRPSELFSVLNILRPKEYASFYQFAWTYCEPKHNGFGWTYNGAKNLGMLHRNLTRTCMIRRRKEDVLKDLPEKSRFVVPMAIDRKVYDGIEGQFVEWWESQGKDVAKAIQIVKLGELKRAAARLKLRDACEWITNFLESSDGKLAAFAIHKEIVGKLRSFFHKECVVVDGSTSAKDRQAAVDDFQRKKGIRLFIGNIQAAGLGITLTAADTCAFIEMGWTPGEHSQAEDRIHRIGQTKQASCYYLVAAGTIEERLCQVIQEKQEVLDRTLDGEKIDDAGNVFDLLIEELRK